MEEGIKNETYRGGVVREVSGFCWRKKQTFVGEEWVLLGWGRGMLKKMQKMENRGKREGPRSGG